MFVGLIVHMQEYQAVVQNVERNEEDTEAKIHYGVEEVFAFLWEEGDKVDRMMG